MSEIVDELSSTLCDGLEGSYTVGIHVFGIFVILFSSLAGCALPLITKYVRFLRENPFVFAVGKNAATGVLLSVSCIHLIHEASESFEEPCIANAFTNYSAYHFLFALIAALLMHALDQEMAETAERWMKAGKQAHAEHAVIEPLHGDDEGHQASPSHLLHEITDAHHPTSETTRVVNDGEDDQRSGKGDSITGELESPNYNELTPRPAHSDETDDGQCEHHEGHGHQHLFVMPPVDMGHIRRVISAVCMEFGVTLHSVFVGITVGLTTNTELKPLLVALFFHQLFEGMALGSRLVDASFGGKLEYILALIFSLSAPFGMIVSTIAVSVSKSAMAGTNFVTTMAILDALCGGILLYLAFTLLLGDFVEDMKTYGAKGEGRLKRKFILYGALWAGMLLMAYVGKWL